MGSSWQLNKVSSFRYDSSGRRTSAIERDGAGAESFQSSWNYDANGNQIRSLIEVWDQDFGSLWLSNEVTTEYDGKNRAIFSLERRADGVTKILRNYNRSQFAFDAEGNRTGHVDYWNEVSAMWETSYYFKDSILLDGDGRTSMVINLQAADSVTPLVADSRTHFEYDSAGRKKHSRTETWNDRWITSYEEIYTLDSRGRPIVAEFQSWNDSDQWTQADRYSRSFDDADHEVTEVHASRSSAEGQWQPEDSTRSTWVPLSEGVRPRPAPRASLANRRVEAFSVDGRVREILDLKGPGDLQRLRRSSTSPLLMRAE